MAYTLPYIQYTKALKLLKPDAVPTDGGHTPPPPPHLLPKAPNPNPATGRKVSGSGAQGGAASSAKSRPLGTGGRSVEREENGSFFLYIVSVTVWVTDSYGWDVRGKFMFLLCVLRVRIRFSFVRWIQKRILYKGQIEWVSDWLLWVRFTRRIVSC